MKILILHGPNLNLLGEREPEIYGKLTLDELNKKIETWGKELMIIPEIRQSNHEGNLIDWIHESRLWASGIVLNPGAYTHTSYALRDAVSAVKIPTIEVHLTNIYSREQFRHKSVLSGVCLGQISGFGEFSYYLALAALKERGLRRLTVV